MTALSSRIYRAFTKQAHIGAVRTAEADIDVTSSRASPPTRAGLQQSWRPKEPTAWALYGFITVLGIAMYSIALSGCPNLLDNERRVGAYVLDAVQNGHWLIQRDVTGEVASKPPLLTWIAALVTLGFGEINRFAIYLPSALAAIGVALLILTAGKRYFGWQAGFLGALMYLLSAAGDRQMMTARYDGLLALPVTLAALAAFRGWTLQRGWTWFWLAGALGTLAKGPIALILGASGLPAHLWEKRTGHTSRLRGSHWAGVLLYLTICGGWFLLAYADMGQPLVQKMLGRELAAHATGLGRNEMMFLGFYEPPLSFLAEFAPWSLLACLAFWRIARHPSGESETRRFERFLTCWFFFGLLLFCVAAHQRGRLVFPLIPAAALLAGRQGAKWVQLWSTARLMKTAGAFAGITLSFLVMYHHVLLAKSSRVQKTLGYREFAVAARRTLGDQFPLVHVDTPFAVQFYLNTARPLTSFERAADLLQGNSAAFVAVSDFDKLLSQIPTNLPGLQVVARWPATDNPLVRVVSNRASLDALEKLATTVGPLRIQLENLTLIRVRDHELVLRAGSGIKPGVVSIVNESASPQIARVRCLTDVEKSLRPDALAERTLAPAEKWSLTF